jgi:hypothetical protein
MSMNIDVNQPSLPSFEDFDSLRQKPDNGIANRLDKNDIAFHAWYRFVLSFPPHLVRYYLEDFGLTPNQTILDPFCGTGTTLIEAKLLGFQSIGVEANPFAHFASEAKTNWNINAQELRRAAREIGTLVSNKLAEQGINDGQIYLGQATNLVLKTLSPEESSLLITNSISPIPLHKALVLLEGIQTY